MSALKDESVRFRAGYNAARAGGHLQPSASEEARAGYEAYFLEYMPPIPRLKCGDGCNSELAKSKREIFASQAYLNRRKKNGIK